MADQQPTVVKKGDDPLTGGDTPPPSTKQDEPDSGAQQQAEERSIGTTVLTTTSSAPRSIMNGLQLKLDGQDQPFASFTYALSPLTEKSVPVDWKLLVAEDVQSQHIRWHELQAGDDLPKLIADFQNAYAMAVVLINTSDNYSLHPSFLKGTQVGRFPVLMLTKSDGMTLMSKIEQYEENVFAKISAESYVDLPVRAPLQKDGKGPAQSSPDHMLPKEQATGVGQRLRQLFAGDKSDKRPSIDLKLEIKKLIFPTGGDPLVISESAGTFTMVMATFHHYERQAKPESSHPDVNETLKKLNRHLAQTFVRDFPFYLLLAYKMQMKPSLFQCEEMNVYVKSCCEKMESMEPNLMASTFLAFLQRRDFAVQFGSEESTSVFYLLQQACIQMAKLSHHIRQREVTSGIQSKQFLYRRFVYNRFMWVSLSLRLHAERGIVTRSTVNTWRDHVIKYHGQLVMGPEMVAEVKEGLEFGRLVHLPSDLTFSSLLLADLVVSDGQVRPFQHLQHYVRVVESYIPLEMEFLNFITQIRAVYDSWLKQVGQTKLVAVSLSGTIADTLQKGLNFLDTLLDVWTQRKFDPQAFDPECTKWLLLLLQLVDITGDNPHIHYRRFILGKTGVTKRYRQEIKKHVIEVTQKNFPHLTVQQFFPLYRAFHIWPSKFLEEYLREYKVPSGVKISDATWRELFSEVVNRFSGAQHHYYLLDFLQSVAERYRDDHRAGELVLDLLQLKVPKLFAVVEGGEEDKEVGLQFSSFLRTYISRNALKHTILGKIAKILSVISEERDEFQQLVLAVVQKEVIPEFKALQGAESVSSNALRSVVQGTVSTLCRDLSWLQALTTKQRFCWGIVASCCGKIPTTAEHFDWVHSYSYLIKQLGYLFNAYCTGKKLPQEECLLSADALPQEIAHSPSEDIRKYFEWVRHVQEVLLEWKQKFMQQRINYDEILTYASHQPQLDHLGRTVCASSAIVDTQDTQATKNMLLNAFEQLNALLIKYIPGQPDAKWCTLPSVLADCGVALPPNLLDLMSRHVLFPLEESSKAGDLLDNPLSPNTTGIFRPGQDISLKLTKALTLHDLSTLVQGLEAFLQPVMDVLDMLVFFKLHHSEMFDKYLHVHFRKESEPAERESRSASTLSAFSFSVPVFPATSMQPRLWHESAVEGLPLRVLLRAMNNTRDLIMKLMQGTATYSEIIAGGELNLENLNIEREFLALHSFSAYLKLPLASYEGLAGVRSMLELFQYIHQIQTIRNVCEQYQLQGCLDDPQLHELLRLVEELSTEESRAKLTPLEASRKMERVKKILCLDSKARPHCLDLFTAVRDSAAFYQFVRDKRFVGDKGQAVFRQQYQLITAQLQHEEYDERVLNHLYAAFNFIGPFMDTRQDFRSLMLQVTRLDVTNGLKQLETVNTNITLIRLWFSRAEGDTLQNVAKELDRIIATGYYIFFTSDTGMNRGELRLEYSPSPSQQPQPPLLPISQPSSLEDPAEVPPQMQEFPRILSRLESRNDHEIDVRNVEHWNSEQINDFVRKLGFLDTEKEGGDKIKHFLHVNETAYKLLELYMRLRELGHPNFIHHVVTESLACAVGRGEADGRVHETEMMLTSWMQRVADLRSQYDWLLFFNVPKLLILYHLLRKSDPDLQAIVHEISFLCSNEQAALESAWEAVEKSLGNCRKHIESDNAPMHVVGRFLGTLFNNHSLPKRCGEGISRPRSVSRLSLSSEPTQLLHYCPRYSQTQLIRLIVSIYDGVPEAFEVFHCRSSSTEEELGIFLKRAAKHPLQYLILEVNRLPFKLQEHLMQLHLTIQQTVRQEKEAGTSSKAPCLHFVETAPSILREMPWVVLREHKESGPSLDFEGARKICIKRVARPEDFACVQLVYGRAGDGKTHYIQQQLAHSPAHLTIAVNEAFTPLNAISKLRTLPLNQRDCAIFFNFTMLPPGESVDVSERVRYRKLMEVIGWFFFDLLVLGYVEDSNTGQSFRIPGSLAWAIYVEVPSRDHNMMPGEALKHFREEVPVLGLLGTSHYINPDTPYSVDEDVQLVCKYLKALRVGGLKGIDRLYLEVGAHAKQPVKFSTEPDLQEEECQQLLLQYMPEHIRNTKITQRLFIKYMKRRCGFLDTLPAFNYNTGGGEYIFDEQGQRVRTNTKHLGSTLLNTMLREVADFCDPDIKENWSLKPHQQLIYDFKDGGASLGLISLHPDQLPDEDKMRFKSIGVKIPSMTDLYSRKLLDEHLSRALNVELENGQLTPVDDSAYVLTLDYTIKMLNIHERYECGVPVIIEGETGVGKTALVEMLSKLWNHALLVQWKRQRSRLLDFMRRKLGEISVEASDNYQVCVQTVEALSVSQLVPEEDLVLLGQLPDITYGHFHSRLRSVLLPMQNDPVVALLSLRESQYSGIFLEELFKKAEMEGSAESTARLLYGVLSAQIKPTFYKLNVHAAMTPADIWNHFEPVFAQAKVLREAFESRVTEAPTLRLPFVTVFLDEVNTSSCVGLFKEIIVDRTFDGEPIPDNVFIVAACNPHRGNSLASHSDKGMWMRGSYYVRRLHPTLRFLMWDYGSLDEHQERDYINAKMRMLNRQMPNAEVASLTDLIVTSQKLMRSYALQQLISGGLAQPQAQISSRSCVSQRDIQRVFTLYQWVMASYNKYQPYGERDDYSRRAVLVALGIVYYMRLNGKCRKNYEQFLDKEGRLPNEVSFSQAFGEELNWYINQVELPTGIARTQALKENLFATIVCTVTHTPLIIVGAPGSSKTLSFNLCIANLKGQESKMKLFRDTSVFSSLDPHFYQCSRRTTSNEIQTVFSRAINRQRSHTKFKLPIYCVVFMDEAGLPEESHESLKVLHYHLDRQEVSFVAITNHVLDAAKTNRAVSLFRPEASDEDLETLAKGCLCSTPENPPPELKKDLDLIVKFCPAYSQLMKKPEINQFFGLRDFIHFVNYLRRRRTQMLTPQLVMEALERNFNGSDDFEKICKKFLSMIPPTMDHQVQTRGILEVMKDSLEDRPQQHGRDMTEAEVRYKLIIDPSEDDSLVRLLFSFGVLQRGQTRMFVCSDFPGDSQLQKINTIAAIRHSAIEGHTVVMSQTDDIHESFYDLFNQRFRRIDDPQEGARYYTNIAIGAHLKPSRVHPNFQCIVVVKKSEVQDTPAPFLNRFEKYCITHHSLLKMALDTIPPCIKIIVETAMEKVQEFIDCISGPSSLYGLQQETLDSLVLMLLPPLTHKYDSLGEPSVMDSSLDLKVLLMQELLQNLRHCAGFCIPPYSLDELHLDTDQLFFLVLSDPEFDGLLPNLSHADAVQAVAEAMSVLHSAPAPAQEGAAPADLSSEGCLVVALLQQWLVRHLCKQLMQLMTSEAFTLYRNKLPSSYLENYLSFHAHFSLQDIIQKYHFALEHSELNHAMSPTKLLCFTRSSPLIHQLPAQYPSSVFEAQATRDVHQTLSNLVFPEPSRLVVCKLSSLLSQSSVQEMLRGFVRSDTAQVCLLVANMQDTSRQVVNHLRIMIEEAEQLSTRQAKLFVVLLHFPPAQFFDPCYPSLFLKGWEHCYLDTVAHSAVRGVVDIRDWFWQCCFPQQAPQPPERDSLVLALKDILPDAVPVLSSRVFFGSSQEASFNRPMSGSQRSEALRELLFKKGVGRVLCERFRSYWKPSVMAEYLERAANFTKTCESTLNITDFIQTKFKSLFFDFLVYLLSRINEEFNIDILFDSDCTPAVQELFLDILRVYPLPKLSQIQAFSTNLPAPTPDHPPRFPFFKVVCGAVERIVEQSHEDTNKKLDLLREEEVESSDSAQYYSHDSTAILSVLQEVVGERITRILGATPKESLVLAVEAMGRHFDLWQRYFNDFLLHKLRLGGLRGEAISQQILHVFFGQLHEQEAMIRMVSLHCYIRIYHLNLAKMATLLRPLNQIQQIAKAAPHLLSPSARGTSQEFVTAVRLTPHPLGTPEHLSSFVVNTLFDAIVGSIYGQDSSAATVLDKTAVWFRAYRDVMSLPMLKQHVYVALEPQQSGGGAGGKGMEAVEARLNVMQAVFLAIQSSPSLDRDILLKGQQIFQTLFNRNFTEKLERRDQFPHLAEVTSVAVEIISETSFSPSLHRDNQSVRLLMEGLFAHYFSSRRRGYHYEDVHWFLELANEQEQWGANPLEHRVVAGSLSDDLLESAQHQLHEHHPPLTRTQVPQGAISMCVFKLYLGRILGSCDQHVDEVATLSGPLLLYHHQPRSQVGSVLMAMPDLGSPGPYIPTYYQECSPIKPGANSENQRMQQPLAHLYFLTLLEHLQAEGHKLSALVRTANTITKLCTSPTVGDGESIILWVELQAVVQVVLQQLATHLDPSESHRMGEVQPLADDINRLLDDVATGGGETLGHGMVLALHMMKLLKSSRKFSELLTVKYDSICRGINCLQHFHEQLADPSESKPHLLPFMLPRGEETVLGMLYHRVRKVMVGIHQGKEEVEGLVHIAEECIHSVRITSPAMPTESGTRGDAVDKRLCFRMMVWLCAYYDFYDQKVTSQLLCNVMGGQLSPYLREEGYIRLIQCFLNPQLMVCSPESPNPLREDLPVLELLPGGGHHTLERRGKKMDPIYELFMPSKKQQIDQSDVDLRHSLANLVGVVLGCPSRSNHLWYHLFDAEELHETYMTGFMYDAKINPDGLLYDCGVELSPEGQYGRQDYVKHATRGTYTLHSLYLLLWANFGSFCMALLTQPEATRNIHGPIISDWISVRHYCVSQLRTVWMHMRNNLGLSDEERSFLVMRCTKKLYELVLEPHDSVLPCSQLLNMDTIIPDALRGAFRTRQELDGYEQMWHTCIYQPSWNELKAKFAQYSQLWLNTVFLDIRRLEFRYPHYPSERDFTHSVLSSGDIRHQAQGGDLYLLARFAQEWPRLQAGGTLLPDLVEFYQWLHMALAHMVTYERATSLPIGRVVDLAVQRYSREMGEYIRALYNRVKDGYNKYVELIGGAIGAGACAALRQGNKVYTIADDIPLLHFLSDVVEEEEGNDWLYTVVADIIAAHNAFIEGVYSSVQAQRQAPLARLLPDEPAKVYPSEVDCSNCIVGKFESLHGINDFLQLVRSRYQPPPHDTPTQPQRYMSISQTLLQPQTPKAPEFQLYLLQEDIVAWFLAGKPLIRIEPSSLLRTLFKFRQSPGSITAAGPTTDVVGSAQDLEDIAEKLPDKFKVSLQETLQKRMEYEFHSASYHTMVEVVTGLRTVAGHLIKALMEQTNGTLERLTVPEFMLTLYDHLDRSGEVLGEIGVRSPSSSQMACLVELPLPALFCCMQLFACWVRDGVYDFAALPFGIKTHMTYQDLQSVLQIPLKWTGSRGDLLEEIKQMNEVLKHSEAHITTTANEAAHKPIMQYLQEIHILGEEDLLPNYIPPSILIQHYVSFRMALRRLVLTVQQQVEAEGGDTQRDQWREFVGDLWDNRLPHLRSEVYGDGAFMFDPHTGRYGFQEGSEFDSEGELMDDFMNEPEQDYTQGREDEESFFVLSGEQQPSLESSREEETKGAEHPREDDELECLLRKDPEFQKKVLSMARSLHRDTLNLVQSARDYTPKRVGQFLEGVGLGHHVDAFCVAEISGEVLLDATEEMLEELGVTSATERLKIKVLFRRSLQGGVVKYPLQMVVAFLKEHKLEKYCTVFQEGGMDGDLLLEADDNVLKELGVKSAVDRIKIRTKYKTHVSS